jgi:hypothetical protein
MKKFEKEYWEVKITCLVEKGYSAMNKQQLHSNIEDGMGGNEMGCIEVKDLKINIK